MNAYATAILAILVLNSVTSQLTMLDDNIDQQIVDSYSVNEQDFYPGMIGFNRVADNGQAFTINGIYLVVYGVPGIYKFIYGYFDGRTQYCANILNELGNSGKCYLNSLPFTWEYCSDQEQDCWINGSAVVRFGESDKYIMFRGEEKIPCNYRNIGDPSPGKQKHCGFLRIVWTNCGMEGSRCNFAGSRLVKFTGKGRNSYKEANNGIDCNLNNFSDPINGSTKVCEFLPYDYTWVECAKGGNKCRFFGITVVKIANFNGINVYKDAAFEIDCPAQSICYYALFN